LFIVTVASLKLNSFIHWNSKQK